MSNNEFDLDRCMNEDGGKCVNTRGRPVRVICTDKRGPTSIVVLVQCSDGDEILATYTNASYCHDLRNLPRKLSGWVNIYPDFWKGNIDIYRSKAGADYAANKTRIACIYLEFEEGEGL